MWSLTKKRFKNRKSKYQGLLFFLFSMREFSFLANEGLDGLTGIVSCVDPPSRKWGGGKLKEGGWGWKIWPGGGGANFKHTFREPKYRLWLFFLSGTSYEFPYHEAGNPDVLICSDLFHRQRGNGGRRKGMVVLSKFIVGDPTLKNEWLLDSCWWN